MKKSVITRVYVVLALFAAFSCNKDDDSFPDYAAALTGGWKYREGADKEKYLLIYNDRTSSILFADDQGIRDRVDGVLLVTANQIMIDNGLDQESPNISVFNYRMSGDSLILSKPSQSIVLLRDNSAPEASAWIKPVTASATIEAPINEPTDITYDGALLWYGNGYSSDYIYKINPANGAKDSVGISQSAWAVEADGSDLWVSSDGTPNIFRIDKTTGNTLATSTTMGAWIYGIARDNNYLWCYSNNENTLYKYNSSDNTVPVSTATIGYWDGLTMAGSSLYVACNGKLHKCTLAPLMGTASYELPGYYIYGVAFDGTDFWVSAYKLPYEWPEIIKLSGVD